jgi:hypothetical protein
VQLLSSLLSEDELLDEDVQESFKTFNNKTHRVSSSSYGYIPWQDR